MIFFFLIFLSVQIKDTESFQLLYGPKNLENALSFEDQTPTTKNCFASVYSGDESKKFGYIQGLLVLGFSIQTMSPEYDRVLIINNQLPGRKQLVAILKKAWTHIIFRNPLDFPNNRSLTSLENRHLFKLQGWSLQGYEKVIFLGADVILFSSISNIFEWPAPAASPDYYNLGNEQKCPKFNSDFMLIHPNAKDYLGLLYIANSYIAEKKDDDEVSERFIINRYYRKRISLFNFAFAHENGGDENTYFGDPYSRHMEINTRAVHFGRDMKPWLFVKRSLYKDTWTALAAYAFEKLDVPFSTGPPSDTVNPLVQYFIEMGSKTAKRIIDEDDDFDQDIDLYPTDVSSGTRRTMTLFFLMLFASLLMMKTMVGKSNPFNVFVVKMGEKINQFVKLDDDPSLFLQKSFDN